MLAAKSLASWPVSAMYQTVLGLGRSSKFEEGWCGQKKLRATLFIRRKVLQGNRAASQCHLGWDRNVYDCMQTSTKPVHHLRCYRSRKTQRSHRPESRTPNWNKDRRSTDWLEIGTKICGKQDSSTCLRGKPSRPLLKFRHETCVEDALVL